MTGVGIAKEALRDSSICRLCGSCEAGVGAGVEDRPEQSPKGPNVFPIYDRPAGFKGISKLECCDSSEADAQKEETLGDLINRYLPIKVHKADLYYPQVICSTCFALLEDTVRFFDKIMEGQGLLQSIINQITSTRPKPKPSTQEISCYENTPTLPRKRGRPRRTEKSVQISSSSSARAEVDVDSLEPRPNLSEKPRRVSRPPQRYSSSTFVKDEQLEEYIKEKAVEVKGDTQAEEADSGNCDSDKPPTNSSADAEEEPMTDRDGERNMTDQSDTVVDHESDSSVRTVDMLIRSRTKRRGKRKRRPGKGKDAAAQEKFKCGDCDKAFVRKDSLKYHCSVRHSDRTKAEKFKCEICGKPFISKSLLSNHLHSHSTDQPFKCDLCTAKFKNKSSLYTHKASTHSGKSKAIRCDVCGSQFTLNSSLKAHMRLHTNEKPYVCEFCNKAFTQLSNMREHRRTHTGERRHQCKWQGCGKRFVTSTQLKMHENSHNNVKSFFCDICGKGICHSVSFKHHMKRHHNQRDVVCELCNKGFITKDALKLHLRVHTGEKPYKCHTCERTFSNSANCEKHKKIHIVEDDSPPSTPVARSEQSKESVLATEVVADPALEASCASRDLQEMGSTTVLTEVTAEAIGIRPTVIQAPATISDDQDQQVIYIYPENLPIFTVTLEDNQAIEVRGPDGSYQMMRNLDQVSFATIDNTDKLGTQFINVELNTATASVTSVDVLTQPEEIRPSAASTSTSPTSQSPEIESTTNAGTIQKS